MKIRKAEYTDIDSIADIYNAIHDEIEAGRYDMKWDRHLYPTRDWAVERVNAGDIYVMIDNGDIVASAVFNHNPLPEYASGRWCQDVDYEKDVLVLHTLVVRPDMMKHGYATVMIRHYEEMAVALGCSLLRLDTQAMNKPARRLYQKLGYTEMDRLPCFFKGLDNLDLLLIEKKL